jgi:hypothetical protein
MAGNINEFKSSFTKDLARTNRFDVDVTIPLVMVPYVSSVKSLKYRCENANLPGRTLATAEQRTYGPIEKYPYLNTYGDLDLTFIVDDDMEQKILFDAWLNYINPLYNNNIRYKGDYATILKINQYDVTGELSYSINLYDAYPISMNQMDLDWSGDGYHKLNVTFAYTRWENNSTQALAMQLVDYGINQVADMAGSMISGLPTLQPLATGALPFNEITNEFDR